MFVIRLLSLNFVLQTNASVNALLNLPFTSSKPVNLSHSFLRVKWDSQRRSRKN
jgi:hypothetical protein